MLSHFPHCHLLSLATPYPFSLYSLLAAANPMTGVARDAKFIKLAAFTPPNKEDRYGTRANHHAMEIFTAKVVMKSRDLFSVATVASFPQFIIEVRRVEKDSYQQARWVFSKLIQAGEIGLAPEAAMPVPTPAPVTTAAAASAVPTPTPAPTPTPTPAAAPAGGVKRKRE